VDVTSGRPPAAAPGKRRPKWPQGVTSGRERASNPDEVVYGALDLGTNNCRLLLATPSSSGFTVVDAFSRIVRLGEGASQTGRLSDSAMSRTI